MADNFTITEVCNQCNGAGTVPDVVDGESINVTCPRCTGDGTFDFGIMTKTEDSPETYQVSKICGQCFGTGELDGSPCLHCDDGKVLWMEAVEIA